MTAAIKAKHTEDQVGTVSRKERRRKERLLLMVDIVLEWSERIDIK